MNRSMIQTKKTKKRELICFVPQVDASGLVTMASGACLPHVNGSRSDLRIVIFGLLHPQ
jgi:hypothetical protein